MLKRSMNAKRKQINECKEQSLMNTQYKYEC